MRCTALVLSCFVQSYEPPPEFDFEPTEPYLIATLPEREVMRVCNMVSRACAIPARRLIIVSDTLKGEFLSITLRHEKAHLNGWVHP